MSVLLAAGGCSGGGEATVPSGRDVDRELRDLRRAAAHPIYYAGKQFEGLPLTAVDFDGSPPRYVSFAYGTCTIALPADGGCAVPVSIQLDPFRADQWRRAVGCTQLGTLRGVPAVRHDGVVLVTKHGILKIYAAQAREVVTALRPLDAPRAAAERLPPPPAAQVRLVEAVCRS